MQRSWQISRRAVLRGAGVTLALPFLEQMQPRVARAAPPSRVVVMYKPNGNIVSKMVPSATGTGFDLPPTLTPLANVREYVSVVSGMQNSIAGPHDNLHLAGIGAFLTGAHPELNRYGISMDQMLADAWKGTTSLPSLELGGDMTSGEFTRPGAAVCEGLPCKIAFSLSYTQQRAQKPTETNPQAAFDRVFGVRSSGGQPAGDNGAALEKLRRRRQSVLDAVRADATRLNAKLGVTDQRKMDAYLTSVKELEARLAALTPAISGASPPSCGTATRPNAQADNYPARLDAMIDVIALALQCNATRVVTFMMAEAESEYNFPMLQGARDGHHGASHHGNDAAKVAFVGEIDKWYVGFVAKLAAKLKAMPEAGGNLLDNTVILHGSEVADGNTHSYSDMPIVLVGGKSLGLAGKHARLTGRPLAALHLTLLQKFGVPTTSFGNSTGTFAL